MSRSSKHRSSSCSQSRQTENVGGNPGEGNINIEEALKVFTGKIDKLASQEYIEEKFKHMITEDFLTTKLKDLEKEVKSHVKKEIDKVYKHVGELKDRVKTAEETIEQLRNKVSDMETSIEKLSEENKLIGEENAKMKEQHHEREVLLKVQSEEINNLEQYTRKNSIRIYGVHDNNSNETNVETATEVIKLINDKLNIKISMADIDIAHRMGRHKPDANRPIICKFVARAVKHDVVKARRMLKKTAVVIREDLTLKNAKLLEKTAAHESVKTAWSDDGKILALLSNDKKIVVDWKTDISRLIASK